MQKEIHGIVWRTEAVTEEKPDLCLLHINIPLSILHVIFFMYLLKRPELKPLLLHSIFLKFLTYPATAYL